ncbi:MAG: 30S ribosome-binding factor RbfA [Candidatus Omnitrophica bacterium]|nr:30S ribosome-binding factor RbfA [Candidatus Omnitrophota bacterium]
MAQKRRVARVAEVIRMELAGLILNELKDPRVGFVTVMGVEVTPDLREAKVFISVMGTEKEKKSTLIALNNARGFLQHMISEAIRLKSTPLLHFKLDDSIDQSIKIDGILKTIEEQDKNEKDI